MRILPLLVTSLALVLSPLLAAGDILVKTGESIAFLGDSITQQGAGSPGGYVRLVASGLAAQGIDVTVIPAGISGHKSNQMLARLEEDVLSKKPNWMALSCGVNDVMHQARGEGVLLEDYKKNITEILDRCQQAGVKVIVLTATQIGLPLTKPANVKLADYNAFLREAAKARNLPLADLSAAMADEQAALEKAGVKRSLTGDGVHMNLYGNLMMAKGVLTTFGLDEQQLAAANASWRKLPDIAQVAAKINLSLDDQAALEAYAAGQKKSVEALVSEIASGAVKAALKPAATR